MAAQPPPSAGRRLESVQESDDDAGTRGPDRVTESDRTTVNIDLVVVDDRALRRMAARARPPRTLR